MLLGQDIYDLKREVEKLEYKLSIPQAQGFVKYIVDTLRKGELHEKFNELMLSIDNAAMRIYINEILIYRKFPIIYKDGMWCLCDKFLSPMSQHYNATGAEWYSTRSRADVVKEVVDLVQPLLTGCIDRPDYTYNDEYNREITVTFRNGVRSVLLPERSRFHYNHRSMRGGSVAKQTGTNGTIH